MRAKTYLIWVASVLFLAVAPAWAQEEPPDLIIYRQIFAAETPTDKRIELCETFLGEARSEFLDSTYRNSVLLNLWNSYTKEKQWAKLMDTADRLEKLVPKMSPEDHVRFYLDAMGVASRELKDIKRTIALGKKVLALEPNNLNALLTLATAIPPLPADPEEQVNILGGIIEYDKKVLSLDRPEAVPADQWENIRKTVQIQVLTLEGTVLLTKKDYVGCAGTYESLIKVDPRNTAAYYRLGICHYYQVRDANEKAIAANEELRAFVIKCNDTVSCNSPENTPKVAELEVKKNLMMEDFEKKRSKAMDAFARCVAIGGSGAEVAGARAELEKLYKTIEPKPPDSMDDYIAQRKKELGV